MGDKPAIDRFGFRLGSWLDPVTGERVKCLFPGCYPIYVQNETLLREVMDLIKDANWACRDPNSKQPKWYYEFYY